MRLHIRFQLERAASIPIDHQHALMGLVYNLLSVSDAEYSSFLHDEGYHGEGETRKMCKLFTFSGLRIRPSARRIVGDRLQIDPGPVDWLVSSPKDEFLLHSATGILSLGSMVDIGSAMLRVESVEAMPAPEFRDTTEFTCLTPIVATLPREDGTTRHLRPADTEFSEAVRCNLLWKHRLLHGDDPADDRLEMKFDEGYLTDPKRRGGTKLINFKGVQLVGAFAPFTLTGSAELKRVGWECGFGGKNGMGCGMAEVWR